MSTDRPPKAGEQWWSATANWASDTPVTVLGIVDDAGVESVVLRRFDVRWVLALDRFLDAYRPPRPALPDPEVRYFNTYATGDVDGAMERMDDGLYLGDVSYGTPGDTRSYRCEELGFHGIAKRTISYEWVEDPS